MKKELSQLTMAEFIQLACGDTSVLAAGKLDEPAEVADAARAIVEEYRQITESSYTAELAEAEQRSKAQGEHTLYSLCDTLMHMGGTDAVRESLKNYGIAVGRMSDKRLAHEVKQRLARAEARLRRMAEEAPVEEKKESGTPKDIRNGFHQLTAMLMAHFKMQIDLEKTSAAAYAYLVARQDAEIKAQLKALRK